MFPFAAGIAILLVPLASTLDDGIELNTPLPSNTLLLLPSKLIVAMLPIPLTLATATLFATAAYGTCPVTLAPVMLDKDAPLPEKLPALTV